MCVSVLAAGHDVRRSLRTELEDALHVEPPLHPAKPASARLPCLGKIPGELSVIASCSPNRTF
jgi:hypothetical protein